MSSVFALRESRVFTDALVSALELLDLSRSSVSKGFLCSNVGKNIILPFQQHTVFQNSITAKDLILETAGDALGLVMTEQIIIMCFGICSYWNINRDSRETVLKIKILAFRSCTTASQLHNNMHV